MLKWRQIALYRVSLTYSKFRMSYHHVCTCVLLDNTVKSVLRDHCQDRTTYSWQKVPHFSAMEPATEDHIP